MGQSVCWLCNSLIGLSVIPEEHYTVRLSQYTHMVTVIYLSEMKDFPTSFFGSIIARIRAKNSDHGIMHKLPGPFQ